MCIRLCGWRHIKCRKAEVPRVSYFSREAFCFHPCGLTAESSFQHSPKNPPEKKGKSLSVVFSHLLLENNANEIWRLRIKLSCVSGRPGRRVLICLYIYFFVQLLNRKSILNSLPRLLQLPPSSLPVGNLEILFNNQAWKAVDNELSSGVIREIGGWAHPVIARSTLRVLKVHCGKVSPPPGDLTSALFFMASVKTRSWRLVRSLC